MPTSPSYPPLRPLAERFRRFSGSRDLFAALSIFAAAGLEGKVLVSAVNERLAQDEEAQGISLDRLTGDWLKAWEESVNAYGRIWPAVQPELERTASGLRAALETVGPHLSQELGGMLRIRTLPTQVMVGVVEQGLGMHRASDGVMVLEAQPLEELWPYAFTHELVHAVTPGYRPGSALHQLAGELLTDIAAAQLGARLACAGVGASPMPGLDKRWDGWKRAYGATSTRSASDAFALALTVWERLENDMCFEAAVHWLALELEA
ncbi:MAG: hypothetical protein AB1492_02345 [Bacillota bacterium]